ISPSSFSLTLGGSQVLTATLTSGGVPLANKTVVWSATAGSLYPTSGVTDSYGRVSTTYTAPTFGTSATIMASFEGDWEYGPSSAISRVTLSFSVTLTFYKPGGTPLANTEIYYGLFPGQKIYLGRTDSEGRIISTDPSLADQTIYYESSDGRYKGSTYIGPSGGSVIAMTEAVGGFPWGVVMLAVIVVIGAVSLKVWKAGLLKRGAGPEKSAKPEKGRFFTTASSPCADARLKSEIREKVPLLSRHPSQKPSCGPPDSRRRGAY
ncbi:MAG: Ig-like domain-containing protein, partial [Candidatus Hadarchaeales archaeon]